MKYYLLAITICIACFTQTIAQPKTLADYKAIIETASSDSVEIEALIKASETFSRNKPRDIVALANIVKALGEKKNNKILLQHAYHQLAEAYSNLRVYDTALNFYRSALQVNSEVNNLELRGQIQHNLGYSFYQQNILDSCLYHYLKALEIKKQVGKPRPIAVTLNGIGLVYRTRNNTTDAMIAYKQALTILEKLNDRMALNVLSNIATLYNLKKQPDSATIIYKDMYNRAVTLKDNGLMLQAQINLALGLNYQEKYTEALPVFIALSNNAQVKQIEDINNAVQYGLGQSYFGVKSYDTAITILKRCLTLRYKNTKYQSLAAITDLLYKAEKAKANYPQALEYYEQLKVYSDSLMNSSRTALIEELDTKYKTAQKEHQIAMLDKDNKLKDLSLQKEHQALLLMQVQNLQRQQQISLLNKNSELKDLSLKEQQQSLLLSQSQIKTTAQQLSLLQKDNQVKALNIKNNQRTNLLFVLGFVIVSIVAASILLLYYNKQKAASLLEEKNAIISKSLADKEVLLKEIHHRVKNNLQVVSSLLNLQSRTISDATALAAIKEGRDRVKSMALLHQNLYQDDNLTGVDVKNYIELLTQSLFNSYNINKDAIALSTDIQNIQLDVDTVIPIGLIVNELISNALKYAFTETEKGLIEISLVQSTNQLLLEVKDNGKGMPVDWNYNNVSASLGYQLIKSFVQKMKGELLVHSQQGTQIKIIINKYKLIA
jgi:two-component sensor histidine kinase